MSRTILVTNDSYQTNLDILSYLDIHCLEDADSLPWTLAQVHICILRYVHAHEITVLQTVAVNLALKSVTTEES